MGSRLVRHYRGSIVQQFHQRRLLVAPPQTQQAGIFRIHEMRGDRLCLERPDRGGTNDDGMTDNQCFPTRFLRLGMLDKGVGHP